MRYRGLEDNAPGPDERMEHAIHTIRMHLAQIAGLFTLGAQFTLVMRRPDNPERYLIVGDDSVMQDVVQKFITKKKGRQ